MAFDEGRLCGEPPCISLVQRSRMLMQKRPLLPQLEYVNFTKVIFRSIKTAWINQELVPGEVHKLLFCAVKREFNSRHHNILIPKIPSLSDYTLDLDLDHRLEAHREQVTPLFQSPLPSIPPFPYLWKNLAAPLTSVFNLLLFRVKSWAEYWEGTIYWRDNTGSWS